MYTLFYDSQCPICTAFARALKKKLPANRITFKPASETQFKVITKKGNVFYGDKALNVLLKEFPEIKSYFSMLPNKLQDVAVKATVKIASAVRKVTKKGCNCGKR